MSAAGAPDLEALLVALVLDPATYSRNRFFQLYTDPAFRRIRRRAALVRGIVRHLAGNTSARIDALTPSPCGGGELAYSVPALGLRRTSRLEAVELSLVRFAMARSRGLAADEVDRGRIEGALRRLAVVAPEPEGSSGPLPGPAGAGP